MIYLEFDTKSIQIPNHLGIKSTDLNLKIINNLTQQSYDIPIKEVFLMGLLFQLEIDMIDGLDDGEYTYKLIYEDEVIESGLMVVGYYNREIKSYGRVNKKIQYKG